MFHTAKMPITLVAAVALSATVSSAYAQGRPNADFNARDASFELAPGSQLRSGDRLTDRLMYSVWQRTSVKGSGICSTRACPVQFNGETVYARLPQLTILSGGSASAGSGGNNPPGEPRRRLQRGDKGDEVRRLQEALNKEGARLTIDSSYGRGTEIAVEEFQRRKRLKVDGIAGRETLQMLGV